MSKATTYWIDLSDLSEWSGHYTGIQRVVFNIAKYYAERSDVKFFVFDRPQTGFFEVEFKIIETPPQTILEVVPSTQGRPHLVRRIASSIPGRYKQRIPASAKTMIKTVYQVARTIKYGRMKLTPKQQNFNLDKQAVFSHDDVILVLGSPWANPDMMSSLVAAKQEIGFKLVQLIYDLIPIIKPYLFGEQLFPIFTRYLFDVVTNSDGLVAISNSSKNDVQKFMDDLLVPKPPVSVIRLGDEFEKHITQKPRLDIRPNEFILCVGTFESRKNHQLLYYAYKEALQRGIELPKLVIVGRRGWLTDDLAYAINNDSDVTDKIFILNNASDSNLSWLYENCRFTVYPAIYEGWGLPIAESLAYGKVCVASNTSSMVEIAPNLVDYFSPYDSAACLSLLQKYSLDDDTLKAKETKITKEYGTHSWQVTYHQFDAFVNNIGNNQ